MNLSTAETITLECLAIGLQREEIAYGLGVNIRTVGTTIERAVKKMDARTTFHAVSIYVRDKYE